VIPNAVAEPVGRGCAKRILVSQGEFLGRPISQKNQPMAVRVVAETSASLAPPAVLPLGAFARSVRHRCTTTSTSFFPFLLEHMWGPSDSRCFTVPSRPDGSGRGRVTFCFRAQTPAHLCVQRSRSVLVNRFEHALRLGHPAPDQPTDAVNLYLFRPIRNPSALVGRQPAMALTSASAR